MVRAWWCTVASGGVAAAGGGCCVVRRGRSYAATAWCVHAYTMYGSTVVLLLLVLAGVPVLLFSVGRSPPPGAPLLGGGAVLY